MDFPPEIFRSYDIRGTNDQLSVELARALGAGIVAKTGAKRVVVGRDMRETSPTFAQAVIEGICEQGADAVDIGMCSTPMFSFAVSGYAEHEAGIMVTASHNPAEYNGFKMYFGDAMPLSGQDMRELAEMELQEHEHKGTTHVLDIATPYLDRLFQIALAPSVSRLKIVVDAGNGMGGVILPKLFQRLDCAMIPMYFEPDGRFPHHEANPIKPETLADLQARVRSEQADFGIALDGDADRIGFVDAQGRIVLGDTLFALLIEDRLKARKGAVVWSPNASWDVRDAIERGGGTSVLEVVGRTHIIKRLKKEEGVLAGEVSAHYFFPELGGLESTDLVILLVLRMLATSGGSFADLVAPHQRYAKIPETNFEVADKDGVIAALADKYKSSAVLVSTLDGVRMEFNDWWFNVRKSNTEPLVRLNLEAVSSQLMEEKRDEVAAFINSFR